MNIYANTCTSIEIEDMPVITIRCVRLWVFRISCGLDLYFELFNSSHWILPHTNYRITWCVLFQNNAERKHLSFNLPACWLCNASAFIALSVLFSFQTTACEHRLCRHWWRTQQTRFDVLVILCWPLWLGWGPISQTAVTIDFNFLWRDLTVRKKSDVLKSENHPLECMSQ